MKNTAALVAVAIAVAGCANSSRNVATAAVSPYRYASYDCDMLAAELDRVSVRAQNLGWRLDEAAKNDQAIMAVTLLLFWPAAFALGNQVQEAEYAHLKGTADAINQTMVVKKCPGVILAPGGAQPQPAAAPAPAYQPASIQGAPAAPMPAAPAARYRPAACDWPGVKQGVGAC